MKQFGYLREHGRMDWPDDEPRRAGASAALPPCRLEHVGQPERQEDEAASEVTPAANKGVSPDLPHVVGPTVLSCRRTRVPPARPNESTDGQREENCAEDQLQDMQHKPLMPYRSAGQPTLGRRCPRPEGLGCGVGGYGEGGGRHVSTSVDAVQ